MQHTYGTKMCRYNWHSADSHFHCENISWGLRQSPTQYFGLERAVHVLAHYGRATTKCQWFVADNSAED